MSVSLIYTTARPRPQFNWFFDSLANCSGREVVAQVVIIDLFAEPFDDWTELDVARRRNEVYHAAQGFTRWQPAEIDWRPPKPNVWSGKFRLTPRNWWAVANARNTGLCLSKGGYTVFLDDRCVLANTFLDAVSEAIKNKYAVCGTYEKVHDLVVENGAMKSWVEPKDENGKPTGKDGRLIHTSGNKMICPGRWMFGCAFGLFTEWMLDVNGVDESWDSVSMEDTMFGQMVENCGHPIHFDPRMKMVEDRSPSCPNHDMKRSSKEQHPNDTSDKTHTLMRRLENNKRAAHFWNLREIRKLVLAGNPFPVPLKPDVDWFDSQPLKEMV